VWAAAPVGAGAAVEPAGSSVELAPGVGSGEALLGVAEDTERVGSDGFPGWSDDPAVLVGASVGVMLAVGIELGPSSGVASSDVASPLP
jgi:hypothetical protein